MSKQNLRQQHFLSYFLRPRPVFTGVPLTTPHILPTLSSSRTPASNCRVPRKETPRRAAPTRTPVSNRHSSRPILRGRGSHGQLYPNHWTTHVLRYRHSCLRVLNQRHWSTPQRLYGESISIGGRGSHIKYRPPTPLPGPGCRDGRLRKEIPSRRRSLGELSVDDLKRLGLGQAHVDGLW